jgi:hypothetical protein
MRNNYRQDIRENRALKYDMHIQNGREETVRGQSNERSGQSKQNVINGTTWARI